MSFKMKIFSKPTCACSTAGASCSSHDHDEKQDSTCTLESEDESHDHSHDHSHDLSGLSPRAEAIFLGIIGIAFFALLFFEDSIFELGGIWTVRALYIIPYILVGLPILREAGSLILKGDIFNEFTLMSMATLVAIGLGETAEAVGVMLFYRVGEHIQERAAGSSRRNIESLLASKPVQARVMVDGSEKMMDVEDVQIGQELIVRAGEKIPLDGIIVSGRSDIDQSPLTGESLPVIAEPGMEAMGGTINLTGALSIRVDRAYEESHMARILKLIEEAAQRKSPTERFITRFARYYTPAVVGIAFLVATIPPLLIDGALFSDWIYRALVMLVISCPCALLISIPLGYFGGIGAASRNGILVKGGTVFDDLANIKTVVFDKTGTLTKGKFSVSSLSPGQGVSEEELLKAASIAEYHAVHPIASAVLKKAEASGLESFLSSLADKDITTKEIPGKGMEVSFENNIYLAGTATLLEEKGIKVELNTESGAIVYLAQGKKFLGSILVADDLKDDSAETIGRLKKRGLAAIMLTGDREEAASEVAKELGLSQYRSGLLPEGKVDALNEMADSESTLFVGDGINDAPILAISKVGVAMGEIGSEAAIEAADAVIINDSPRMVDRLLSIGRDVRVIVWQNIFLALGTKTVIMGFGIAGVSGLWEAIFADVGVAVLAVLNSSRIVFKKE